MIAIDRILLIKFRIIFLCLLAVYYVAFFEVPRCPPPTLPQALQAASTPEAPVAVLSARADEDEHSVELQTPFLAYQLRDGAGGVRSGQGGGGGCFCCCPLEGVGILHPPEEFNCFILACFSIHSFMHLFSCLFYFLKHKWYLTNFENPMMPVSFSKNARHS